MNRWKSLAGATLVAALILAPMGAYAAEEGEAPPPPVTSLEEGAALASPVEAAVAAAPQVAAGDKKVFVCKYVGAPGAGERLDHISSVSVNAIQDWDGQIPGWFSDAHSRSYVLGYDNGQDEPALTECPGATPGEIEVTPPVPVFTDPCGPANASWAGPDFVGGSWIYATEEGVYYATAVEAAGYFFPETAHAFYREVDSNQECDGEGGVPTQFNADAEPPTCASAAMFSEEFLGEPVLDEGDYREYDLENIYVAVWRDVPGEVYIEIYADEGFVLEGLDEDKWEIDEEGTFASRTILLPAQLSGAVACPTSTPASTPTTTPAAAALPATGGTDMTPWGIGAALMMLAGAALLTTRRLARR